MVDGNGRIVEGRRYRHDEAGLTASCCLSSRGLTVIASGCSSPMVIRPRRCGRSPARVMDSSACGWGWRTSCAIGSRASDRVPARWSRALTRRSRWRSCAATPHRRTPAVSESSASTGSSSATGIPVANQPASCSNDSEPARRAEQTSSSSRPADRSFSRSSARSNPLLLGQRPHDRDPPPPRRPS